MSNRNFSSCQRRTDTSSASITPERCRAGIPDTYAAAAAGSNLCHERTACALHRRWVAEHCTGSVPADARVLGLPRVPGRACHYFKVAA